MTKKEAVVDRKIQRIMERDGETWNLEIVLSGAGDEVLLATLARFKKRSDLKPEMRRKVIAVARALGSVLEQQGKLEAVTVARKRSGKGK